MSLKGILIIGSEEERRLKEIEEYARDHVVPFSDLASGKPIGDNPHHSLIIPIDFRVVFSYEQQPEPVGLCRHVSVSVSRERRVPTVEAITMIAKYLNFRNIVLDTVEDWMTKSEAGTLDPNKEIMEGRGFVYNEDFSQNRTAINFLERILSNE